jgi:hypothetical protein
MKTSNKETILKMTIIKFGTMLHILMTPRATSRALELSYKQAAPKKFRRIRYHAARSLDRAAIVTKFPDHDQSTSYQRGGAARPVCAYSCPQNKNEQVALASWHWLRGIGLRGIGLRAE